MLLSSQVYLRQLVCVSDAWRVPQLTGFLDERASMMGVQTQIGEVLDQMDRMSSLCVDYQHQVKEQDARGRAGGMALIIALLRVRGGSIPDSGPWNGRKRSLCRKILIFRSLAHAYKC